MQKYSIKNATIHTICTANKLSRSPLHTASETEEDSCEYFFNPGRILAPHKDVRVLLKSDNICNKRN